MAMNEKDKQAFRDWLYSKQGEQVSIESGFLAGAEYARNKQAEPVGKYCCHNCFKSSGQLLLDRMILCSECGNKRCPKATNHELPCTNSNEPGQAGSVYTHPTPAVAQPPADVVRELVGALTDLLEFHVKSTGITPETIADKEKFEMLMKLIESREKEVREQAEAALKSAKEHGL